MKKVSFVILLLCLLSFIGCQDLLECIINRRPELSDKSLEIAYVNNFYSETITSEIKNETFDDGYYYYFYLKGELPPGIEYYIDYRNIILEGIPSASGSFTFTINLSVDQINNYYDECENRFNDCDGLCAETTSKVYTIVVN
ncbi:hypothetical protein OE09_1820 [Flavobacteriaceae bacterium MAR_2010_72]|nr:hypothetical protein OE09_1820 [Flavobacteriaceae bacterium MAR_2010_72]TVZ59464.1 hypothetical protein NA63_1999 [Flavobacteriaceae bacterium MAR_2010_105]